MDASKLDSWLDRPFSTDMGLKGWVLFLLMVLIVVSLWTSVLNLIKR